MTLDAADLLLVHLVPEAGLEFALPEGGGRHVHRFLPAAEEDLHAIRPINRGTSTKRT
jgi:hypothetical protein